MLIRGFKKWPRNQQIALPILSVFAFGALFNQMQARNSEPVSIHVENPRIIDGDTLETLDKKRVRLSGIDAPDEDGKGNVPKIAAQLYLAQSARSCDFGHVEEQRLNMAIYQARSCPPIS